MSDPLMDEVETLLKHEGRRRDRERLGTLIMILGLVSCAVFLSLGRYAVLPVTVSDPVSMASISVSIVSALVTLAFRPGKNALRLAMLVGRRDRMQRGRNDRIYAVSIAGWGLLAALLPALLRISHGQGDTSDVALVATLPLVALFILMSVGGWTGVATVAGRQDRKWLEDEVTRALRSQAMATGLPLLAAAVTGVFLIGLWRLEWTIIAIPVALMATASLVGLRFVWLDRRAEGDADG